MPKDSLQIIAAEELYKRKWKYSTDNSIWFHKCEPTEEHQSEGFEYFHPYEWKVMKYIFGTVDTSKFVPDNEIAKYRSLLNY